jgi:hypothetical protein
MNDKSGRAAVRPLLDEILGRAEARKIRGRKIRSLAAQFEDIARRNYRRQLRGHFSSRELRALLGAMTMNVPALNRRPFGDTSTASLRALAAPLRVDVKAMPFGRGLNAIRGFYVPAHGRARPTIWLNTTHHRVAVASAFWHELGHHVLDRIGEKASMPAFHYRDDYHAHMSDRGELIADIMLVLAIYPKVQAKRLFRRYLSACRAPTAYQLAACVRGYVNLLAGLPSGETFPGPLYLAGLVHYAKLRWALLAEYGI